MTKLAWLPMVASTVKNGNDLHSLFKLHVWCKSCHSTAYMDSQQCTHTRVSTTVTLSETHYEAMSFALWRSIGKEFLIKSNINNWIACKEGSGSLVMQKSGSLSCKLVKQVSKQCAGVVPKSITMPSNGPSLNTASHNYYFESSTGGGWPTHDPCGRNQANQVKGVVNPHGNIFVR